jgi:catechol 2,3-dioxygenase-like lactoylglutathione lyase family enzyme
MRRRLEARQLGRHKSGFWGGAQWASLTIWSRNDGPRHLAARPIGLDGGAAAVADALAMTQNIATVALLVSDYDEALGYYCDVLGFSLIDDVELGDGKRWVVVAPRGTRGAALLLAVADGPGQAARIGDQTGGRVSFFLETDTFARDHADLLARGVKFLEAPRTEDYGTVAVFADLYGNRWDLIQPKP